jgi:hypothetical protein
MIDFKDTSLLIKEFKKHVKVEIAPFDLNAHLYGSPFQSYYDATSGVYHIDPIDAQQWYVWAHEFGHLVAWVVAGKPSVDQFGCGNGQSYKVYEKSYQYIAESLEDDACAVDAVVHLYAGKSMEYVTKLILETYSYLDTLDFVDGVGYTDEQKAKFMEITIAVGKELLEKYSRLSAAVLV